jgi:hypothetical protein
VDVATYARVMAELADAGDRRGEVLARHGLDEDAWEAADDAWQATLSAALDDDGDGPSQVLSDYAAAYERAQIELAVPMRLETFATVTRLLAAAQDLPRALAQANVTLAAYLRACGHYARRMAEDPELARRFEDLVDR